VKVFGLFYSCGIFCNIFYALEEPINWRENEILVLYEHMSASLSKKKDLSQNELHLQVQCYVTTPPIMNSPNLQSCQQMLRILIPFQFCVVYQLLFASRVSEGTLDSIELDNLFHVSPVRLYFGYVTKR